MFSYKYTVYCVESHARFLNGSAYHYKWINHEMHLFQNGSWLQKESLNAKFSHPSKTPMYYLNILL